MNAKLSKIAAKYSETNYNTDNYSIGGGLAEDKFASNRHEDAKNDAGKLTVGQITSKVAKATDLATELVREVIYHSFKYDMEWHHAGKIPSSYGGGMKKTYFLNSKQIVDLCTNFDSKLKSYQDYLIDQKEKPARMAEFLAKHATFVKRVEVEPKHFICTEKEMNGKFGWFDSWSKSYNLTEYYSGYEFASEDLRWEFLQKFGKIRE